MSDAAATVDLAGPRDRCGRDCPTFVTKWEEWFDRVFATAPPAVIAITDQATYRAAIGAKSRNMLRKADRHGYQIERFDRNDHLAELHAINLSKPIRSGGPMRTGYLEPPAPIRRTLQLCEHHELVSIGVFQKHLWNGTAYTPGELRAYSHLVIVNDLAIVNTILGHADDLPHGIMNTLVAGIVDLLHGHNIGHGRHGRIDYLNYTTLDGPEGLVRFKRSVGFTPTHLQRKASDVRTDNRDG